MSTLNASAPLPIILDALARAGWAELDGRAAQGVRSVLRALGALLPHRSATGLVTACQIADAAGLRPRQTRSNLHVLEDAGIIVWTRGGIRDGRPVPGVIKVVKKRLIELLRRARRDLPARLKKRATETARRLTDTLNARTFRNAAAARTWRRSQTQPGRKRDPLLHAAFTATPSPSGEVTGRPEGRPPVSLPLDSTGLSVPGTTLGKPRPAGPRRFDAVRARWQQRGGEAPC